MILYRSHGHEWFPIGLFTVIVTEYLNILTVCSATLSMENHLGMQSYAVLCYTVRNGHVRPTRTNCNCLGGTSAFDSLFDSLLIALVPLKAVPVSRYPTETVINPVPFFWITRNRLLKILTEPFKAHNGSLQIFLNIFFVWGNGVGLSRF